MFENVFRRSESQTGSVTMTSASELPFSRPVGMVPQPTVTATAVAEPESSPITPLVIERDVLTQHAALAAKLGLHSPAMQEIKRSEFETFLRDSGLRLYDEKQVAVYLTSKYGVEKKASDDSLSPTWGWRPAREVDSENRQFGFTGRWVFSSGRSSIPNGQIHTDVMWYQKLIPIPVLLTIERVVDKFPEDVGLFISDEFDPRELVKDPFLMVVYLGKHYIIERWDEPNYRER